MSTIQKGRTKEIYHHYKITVVISAYTYTASSLVIISIVHLFALNSVQHVNHIQCLHVSR